MIYIPFDLHKSVGGPATFLKNLKHYLDQTKFPYATDPKSGTAIFFPISYDIRYLKKFKKKGGIICQRLDGIYYPEKHGSAYEKRNRKIKEIYRSLADTIVFQSQYSRSQCLSMFGPLENSSQTIIINGVNTDIFYPDLQRSFDPDHIVFSTTGNFRNPDMLLPVIEALDQLTTSFKFTYHIIGPIKNERCAEAIQRPYVIHHDNQSMDQVASHLRASDIFIYSYLNPPCPNSVLEAAATGLPVVGFDSGSMKELLPFSNDLLANVSSGIFHKFSELNSDLLVKIIILSINEYQKYRGLSINACKDYSMDNCGRKYVEVFEKLNQMSENRS